jgi:hypothetical protein
LLKTGFLKQARELKIQRKNPGSALPSALALAYSLAGGEHSPPNAIFPNIACIRLDHYM